MEKRSGASDTDILKSALRRSGEDAHSERGSARSTKTAEVAIQNPSGVRLKVKLPVHSTLWDMLVQAETENNTSLTTLMKKKRTIYLLPTLLLMHQAVR